MWNTFFKKNRLNYLFQYLLAHGEHDVRRQTVPVLVAAVQRRGVRGDLRVLRQDVRIDSRWTRGRGPGGPVRHDGGQAHGATGVHGLRVLGPGGVLRPDRFGRLPADRRDQYQDPVGVLLSAQLMRQSVPVRAAHTTIPPRSVRVAQSVRRV